MHLNNGKCGEMYCAECRVAFMPEEEMFSWEGGYVCGECFDALVSELERHELAGLVGSRVINYRRPKLNVGRERVCSF